MRVRLIHPCRKITAVHVDADSLVAHLVFCKIFLQHLILLLRRHERENISRCVRDRAAEALQRLITDVFIYVQYLVFLTVVSFE